MGSRFQFQLMTEEEARAVLEMDTRQAEFYPDRVRARRRMEPVTTEAERQANCEYTSPRGERWDMSDRLAYLCTYCAWSTRELVAECPKCGETHFAPMGPGSGNLPASVTLASRSSSSPAPEERE